MTVAESAFRGTEKQTESEKSKSKSVDTSARLIVRLYFAPLAWLHSTTG
mgnify:CR=1 FL=1